LNAECILIFSTNLPANFHILRINKFDMIRNVHRPLFLSDFSVNWVFATDFKNIIWVPNFMKIRPLGAKLFHADGRADGQTR